MLFMVPGDTENIYKEYNILLNELRQFNPELLDKHRVLAVTKSDLLDEELIDMLRSELEEQLKADGEDVPVVFISAVAQQHLDELKDVLWRELNAESNKLAAVTTSESIVHRDKDMSTFAVEMADEGEDDIEFVDDDEIEDYEELDDFEYEEEDE